MKTIKTALTITAALGFASLVACGLLFSYLMISQDITSTIVNKALFIPITGVALGGAALMVSLFTLAWINKKTSNESLIIMELLKRS